MDFRGKLFSFCVLASSPSLLHADSIDLGSFCFHAGTGGYEYVGDHGDLIGSSVEGESIEKSVATVDLAAVMAQHPDSVISWIRIEDPGNNFYNTNPGADVDLFALSGIPAGLSVEYAYAGINPIYQGMSSEQLGLEVSDVDFEYGSNDASDLWVSLGDGGSLTIHLSGWDDIGGGGDDGQGEDDPDDGDAGDGGDSEGDVDDDGGTLDTGGEPDLSLPGTDLLGEILPPLLGSGLSLDLADLLGFELRFNEIAPTSEWVSISIGFETAPMTVVPGPTALVVLPVAMGLVRRRRMR